MSIQGRWPRALAALGHPGFRLLLMGQAVALQGTWIQGTAQRWLVLELSNSPFMLGVLGACAGLPILLFSFFGGWLADRLPKVSFLSGVQALILIQALVFGWLVQVGDISVPMVMALAFIMGTGMAFEVPARQSLVFDLTGRQTITNALALHSTAFNLARFSGPAIAGLLMDSGMLAACFYLKAISAAIVIVVLILIMHLHPWCNQARALREREPGFFDSFRQVRAFVQQEPIVGHVLLVIVAFGVLLLPYAILLPSFGRDVLGLGAKEYGFLGAANGLGALSGAIFVAITGHRGARERWWWSGAILFPITLVGLSMSLTYAEALACLFVSGFIMVITSTSAISLLQLHARDALRGQIMGMFTTSFMGFFPVGSLLQGGLGQIMGIRLTIFATAIAALVAVLVAFLLGRRVSS